MRRGERALVREVRLICEGQGAWVFARTLIPVAGLRGRASRLTRLGSRPLGQLLFSEPGVHRGETEMTLLDTRHALYHAALAGEGLGQGKRPAILWGRRTLFRLGNCPLLVNEIFLPELPRFPR